MATLPGSTIGILGGGQLARMGAMAARAMGYRVLVLDPDPACCAAPVADECIAASLDDVQAALRLAQAADVITYDIEKIGPAVTEAVARLRPLRPGGHVVRMIQDRATQKNWLRDHDFPVGPYAVVNSVAEVARALQDWGKPGRLKARQGGYDGRGQARVPSASDAAAAWQAVGEVPCVLEQELHLDAELSVMVARRPAGEVQVFAPSQNWHHDGVLTWSTTPAALAAKIVSEVQDLGRALAAALQLEGLLGAEFFVTEGQKVWVNELAPRPHNTFHQADAACLTSQFEQWVRAICDLPLGATDVVRPVALGNLLGERWAQGEPRFAQALALPGVQVRLYGKQARPGRKMGHLLASGETPAAALDAVKRALALLNP